MNRRVVVTGVGVVTPLSCEINDLWARVCAGESGIHLVRIIDLSDFHVRIGGDIFDWEKIAEPYLLGIKNIQAETLAYDQQVRARADGVAARLEADGQAKVAEVVGNYESQVNQLFDSPAGRAFVAWQAAANIKFAEQLTFQSSDGIPSVLRLRDFARAFMGE